VLGLELAPASDEYAWAPSGGATGFVKETLFPGLKVEAVASHRRFARLFARLRASGAAHVFLCNPDRPEVLLTALVLRLLGRRVYAMTESKFDDFPRRGWREIAKKLFYLPYNGVLVGGARSADYMRFLGFAPGAIAAGYDSVGLDRVRALAAAPPAPDGMAFAARHFTIIARLVPKKNLAVAIDAYRRYRELAGTDDRAPARDLVIFGSGPLEADLRARGAGLDGLRFAGFQQQEAIARGLAATLALVLPSREEQWGLVVNEALAMGVPVLVTDQVGARDSLVRTAVNGYVFEPDNAEGLARLMLQISGDEAEWRRLCDGTRAFAPLADAPRFGDGVRALTGL
jgi:glycosyltransferase involved in cell wall biosynthesis